VWGWGQYSSDYGTTIRLQFSGYLTTAGNCQKLSNTHIRCQVPAGTQGRLELQATVTPSTKQVSIVAVSLPSWASFVPASGLGTVSSFCTFTPPGGSAGQTYRLIFRASVLGTLLQVDLTVTLEVSGGGVPTPELVPSTGAYGPHDGVTDGIGRFSISVPWPSNTTITGRLTECTKRVLPQYPLSVTLVPKWGAIRSLQDIGAVRVAVQDYDEAIITQLRLSSSMDLRGRTTGIVELGDVCLLPEVEPIQPTESISGTTDTDGKFSVALPFPGTAVEGRLTECTKRALPNQDFSVSLIPKRDGIASAADISEFTILVSGYEERTIATFNRISIFGLTSYLLEDICLIPLPPVVEEPPIEGQESVPAKEVDCESWCEDYFGEGEGIKEIGVNGITFSDKEKYTECCYRMFEEAWPESEEEKEIKQRVKEATGEEIKTMRDRVITFCEAPNVRPGDRITFEADIRPPYCLSYVEWYVTCNELLAADSTLWHPRLERLLVRRGLSYTLSGRDTHYLWHRVRGKPEQDIGSDAILEVHCYAFWCGDTSGWGGRQTQLIIGPLVQYPPDCKIPELETL